MTRHIRGWLVAGAVGAVLAVTACQKKTDGTAGGTKPDSSEAMNAGVVKGDERSHSFAAVNKQLELGGVLYGYVDVDGDLLKLAGDFKDVLAEVAKTQPNAGMVAQQDLGAIATMLGLTDVKAMGVSSVADGSGFYRNRMFFYTGGERHGLLAGLGGKPAPLKHIGLAPADCAFFAESEVDFAVVYKTIKEVVAKVAGEPAGNEIENTLKKAGESAAISLIDLIYGLKGRSAVVLRLDDAHPLHLPGPQGLVLPGISLLMCVEGVGQVVEPSLAKVPMLRRTESGTRHIYEFSQRLPFEGVQPAIVIDGGTLFVTSSLPFLDECRQQKSGLGQTAEFQKALAEVGAEGNGLTYVSPHFFEQVRQIESLNPNLPVQSKPIVALVMSRLPKLDRPIVANRVNLDDGILVRAYMNRSFKQDVATVAIYNPVTIGLVAAMAIPAFQKVRGNSQEVAVRNNLRMLAAAADQYCLENGVQSATYDQLVGPDRYVKSLIPIAGENYRTLRFQPGQPLRVLLANGQIVEFKP